MNIIIFGPPGAGKGTQAKNLVKKLNSFQVSTGDMLRDEIKKDTEIGKKIINNMNEGKFVEDEIIKRIEGRKILEKRSDDDAKTILKRYDIYMKETKPVLDFYSSKKGFYEIDGSLNIEEITNKIDEILKL